MLIVKAIFIAVHGEQIKNPPLRWASDTYFSLLIVKLDVIDFAEVVIDVVACDGAV